MARKSTAQGTPATAALTAAGVPFVLHPYTHDPSAASYGAEAAEVLGVDPSRVFKTLMVEVEGKLAVGIVPVSGTLDLKAFAAAMGAKKAAMADPAAAQRRTGYVLGGISPLGQRQPSPTVLDASALTLETLLVSGGKRGLDIELAPADLMRLTDAVAAPISSGSHQQRLGSLADRVSSAPVSCGPASFGPRQFRFRVNGPAS